MKELGAKKSAEIETKLTCPECFAIIVTPFPEAIIWERCPACRAHVWDSYDLMLAERVRNYEETGRVHTYTGTLPGRG